MCNGHAARGLDGHGHGHGHCRCRGWWKLLSVRPSPLEMANKMRRLYCVPFETLMGRLKTRLSQARLACPARHGHRRVLEVSHLHICRRIFLPKTVECVTITISKEIQGYTL